MNIKELRNGNLLIYEACTYIFKGLYFKERKTDENKTEEIPVLTVKSANHDWNNETCGINEVEGILITPEWLKANGFEILNKAMPELWIKPLGGYRYIRYHSGVRYMDFENIHTLQRVPWVIKYVHQMQNACTDYGLSLAFKA